MFKFSRKADYAIVALSHLQAQGKPASAREIAKTYGLSAQMLANVLKSLATAGILSSKRGVAGGYSLGKTPDRITIGEVIHVIDGAVRISDCTSSSHSCTAEENCPAKAPMIMIHDKIKNFVDGLSLADISDHENLQLIQFKVV